MTAAELRARRAAAQRLHRPDGSDPVAIVRGLLAVQAQDGRAARLALRARSTGLTAAAVDAALDDRALVVAWLGRGTLHVVAVEDYGWLLGLTAPRQVAGADRRLAQLGVTPDDAERAVEVVSDALAADGPLSRAALGERLDAAGIRTEGQTLIHLIALVARRGIAVLGPVSGSEQLFVSTRDWLDAAPVLPLEGEARDAALAELARRYLAGHGPATAADLAAWAGLPLRDARAGLGAIAGDLVDGGDGLVSLAAQDGGGPDAAGALEPRLLPAFDPYLLGWRNRSFAVPAAHTKRVYPGGGMLRAAVVVGGAAAGTWTARRRDGRLTVGIDPFGRLPADARAALDAEIADVARFEGLEVGG